MNKKLNRILCIFFVIALCCSLNGIAYAKESVKVRLSAIVELNGDLPSQKDSYAIVLTNSETGEQYCSTIEGDGEVDLEPLVFDNVGTYNYTIEQATGSNKKCLYDNSVYRAKITVVNSESGGYSFSVAVYKDGETDKQDCILFVNTYNGDKPIVPVEPTTKETTTKEATTEKITTEETTTEKSKWYNFNPDNPNTGDSTHGPVLFALIAIASATVICLAVPKKKKKEID